MKALPLWVAVGFGLPLAAHAQLGLRVGGNVAAARELWSRNTLHTQSILPGLGYQAGVYYHVPLGRHWALVPEVQVSHESQQLRKEGFAYDTYYYPATGYVIHDYRASFSYLTVPVMLQRRFGPVYAELGPQVSWLVGGRSSGETRLVDNYLTREQIDQAATHFYTRLEAGFTLGVGVHLPGNWGVSIRAYQGMSSLTHDPKDYAYAPAITPVSGTQYRRTVQVSLTRELGRGRPAVAVR